MFFGTNGHTDTDLAGPFGDGNHHDVHDADTPTIREMRPPPHSSDIALGTARQQQGFQIGYAP